MGIIHVVRHGQASFGAADYDSLSGVGVLQCEVLGEHLAATGATFDRVYSGAMKRQADSAAIVMEKAPACFQGVAVTTIPEFDEHDTGAIIRALLPGLIEEDPALSGDAEKFFRDRRAFQNVFTRVMLRWAAGTHDIAGVETFAGFRDRLEAAFGRVCEETARDQKAMIFTSGGVIAAMAQMALGLEWDRTIRLSWWVRNASVSVFRHKETRPDMLSFNQTAHLEARGDPGLLTYK